MDWQKLLELAPLAVSAIKPGSPEATAFMEGYQRSLQQLQQQQFQGRRLAGEEQERAVRMQNYQTDNQLQQEQAALARLSAATRAFQPAIEGVAETTFDPTVAENALLQRAGPLETAFGVPSGVLGAQIPPMAPLLSARKKKKAQELYDRAEKTYGAEAMATDAITLQTGELFGDIKPSALRALFEAPAMTAEGQPAQPYVKPVAGPTMGGGTESERAQMLLEKRDAAQAAGDRAAAARFQRQYDQLIQVKRELGRADDRESATARERIVQVEGPSGQATWVRESDAVGKPAAQAARAVTGMERQTLAYYNRAKEADDLANQVEGTVAEAGLGSQLQQQYAPNLLQTKDQQRYRQAQRTFTEARLRKESGAAIPQGEYENDARTYFAQPGDSPATRAQKRQARQTVLDGLKFAAGRAYEEFYGEAPTRTPAAGPTSSRRFEILQVR